MLGGAVAGGGCGYWGLLLANEGGTGELPAVLFKYLFSLVFAVAGALLGGLLGFYAGLWSDKRKIGPKPALIVALLMIVVAGIAFPGRYWLRRERQHTTRHSGLHLTEELPRTRGAGVAFL